MLNLPNDLRQLIFDEIDKNCLFRADPEVQYFPYIKKGHILSRSPSKPLMTWCFYLRRLLHNPKYLHALSFMISMDIIKKIYLQEEYNNIQLAGLESSSIPLITGIQLAFESAGIQVNSFTVRKERKDYGLCHMIDGIPNEHPVVFVDDMFNSGSSFVTLVDCCKHELDLKPAKNAYVIVKANYNNINIQDNIIKLNAFFLKDEFDKNFDKDKYWLPKDCEKNRIKRVE